MTSYPVQDYQTLVDLAVQLYGSAEYVVKLALDNGLTLDAELNGSFTLVYDESLTALSDQATYLAGIGQSIATFTPAPPVTPDMLEHTELEHTSQEHN